MFRPGLLAGVVVAVGGGGVAFGSELEGLGAAVVALPVGDDEEAMAAAVAAAGPVDVLVHDLRPSFGRGGPDGFTAAVDGAWIATRAVATTAFLPAERGGRITLVAPAPAADDPHAAAARAAVENLARTLSTEWARFGVRVVAVTPGMSTTDAELVSVAAYLASPAGDYFSGCVLSLGAV